MVFGGKDDDIILGNDGVDLLFGGLNNDFIDGGNDTDFIFGGTGSGTDVLYGGLWKDFIWGWKGTDYIDGGSRDGSYDNVIDRLWGGGDNDYLTSRGDNTRLRGNKGDDQFFLPAGNNLRVHGGPGSDVYQLGSGSIQTHTSVDQATVSFTTPVPRCAEIHGTVWQDLNGNGVRDPGEPGLPGITVTLNNGSAGTTLTMADDPNTKPDETGMYWFTQLPPGTYTVRIDPPPSYRRTYPPGNSAYTVSLDWIDVVTGKDFGIAPCAVLPSGLVLWLPLDEPGGNIAYNRAGGLNGRHTNGPAITSGLVDASRCYNGANQFTEVPSHGLINIGVNDFSLDAWVLRAPDSSDDVQVITDKRAKSGGSVLGYVLFVWHGRLWCQLADGSFENHDSGLAVPADNQWHFVALSVIRSDPSGGRFHVDGATAPFDPTARAGTLANNGPFRVGYSSLSDGGYFRGCIDEVELFNRALDTPELEVIYHAGQVGKCKLRCFLPEVTQFCDTQQLVTVTAQICNYGGITDTIFYSFALSFFCGNNIASLTIFNPASGSVVLGAVSCTNLPVTIKRPIGMIPGSTVNLYSCYEMVVHGAESGRSEHCEASVANDPSGGSAGALSITGPIVPVYITRDGLPLTAGGVKATNVPVTFRNSGGSMLNFTARFSVSINHEPPEPALTLPVTVPPGGSSDTVLAVGFNDADNPAAICTILIEADLDGDGEFEPLSSFAVREVVQGQMQIDWMRVEQPGALPVLQPPVWWSGFGALESAPGVRGAWSLLPGNPGSPYLVPLTGTNRVEFFRLRQ